MYFVWALVCAHGARVPAYIHSIYVLKHKCVRIFNQNTIFFLIIEMALALYANETKFVMVHQLEIIWENGFDFDRFIDKTHSITVRKRV